MSLKTWAKLLQGRRCGIIFALLPDEGEVIVFVN